MNKNNNFGRCAFFVLCLSLCGLPSSLLASEVVGWVESGLLTDKNIKLSVKIDTGAKTSSLSAHDVSFFTKDGKQWVRFMIEPSRTTKVHTLEYPLKRMVKIKHRQSALASDSQVNYELRPVVEIPLCLDSQRQNIEVSLADRSNFLYPMLLGRTDIRRFDIVIDATQAFIMPPDCNTSGHFENQGLDFEHRTSPGSTDFNPYWD